jgi:hypothetical protein
MVHLTTLPVASNDKIFYDNGKGVEYYPDELRKITKTCQDNRSPGRNLKPGPREDEVGVLTARPGRSVGVFVDSGQSYCLNKRNIMV